MSEAENIITISTEFQHIKQKAFNKAVLEILIENGLVKNRLEFDDRVDNIFNEIKDEEMKYIDDLISIRNRSK
ncbi:hypothetical protein [Jeotgalibacillus salarius]|uniref:Uncharacterized protein n=1 Tax=Jeotgalibacillus salarius TaxID=546023 RepID=A0A4Y8LLP3_9BACL|nr:hypothetical protein [Jeotgalibacillus salarius]TFE02893.1 hypothetical protein E2626_03550 [Jeotgalibacillus salarius]